MTCDEGKSANVFLTQRALRDIRAIEAYSIEQWGLTVADKYLDKIDEALQRLENFPGLLREEPDISSKLRFYRSGKHYLVCDQINDQIFVLTVIHASMDLPKRIGDLEPNLILEAEILHKQLKERGSQ